MDVNVSVIVPVYNTERYLKKCLASLVHQDFDNYEIIIINDGSTDNSLAICEQFREKFDFITIYSQSNKGLSAARNQGVDLAKGKYIVFVDSDDYVELDFCSKLYGTAERHNVDIVMCSFLYVVSKPDGIEVKKPDKNDARKLYEGRKLDKEEMLTAHAIAGIWHFSWNKIYKRSLFGEGNLEFPVGLYFEDVRFAIDVYERAESFFILPDGLYYYVQRPLSIEQQTYISPKKTRDMFFQYSEAIKRFNEVAANIIERKYIKMYTKKEREFMFRKYRDYQFTAFGLLSLSEAIYDGGDYCFFGASSGAERYIASINEKMGNLFFVDNDKNKHGKKFMGYDVFPPDILKEKRECKIIITSMYLKEIVKQLKDMGVVTDYADVMPFSGRTKLERAYSEGLSFLFNALAEVGD